MNSIFDLLIGMILFSTMTLLGLQTLHKGFLYESEQMAMLIQIRHLHFLAFASKTDALIIIHESGISLEHPQYQKTISIQAPCSSSSNQDYLGFKGNFNSKKTGKIRIECPNKTTSIRLSPPYGFLSYADE
jgi:hypothetical protein